MKLTEVNGKTLAPIEQLRSWPKNPKFIKDENLTKLIKQIEELGFYKPLVVTPDGEILGGNQRFKALTELYKKYPEKYGMVWVSEVEAWSDQERLKYALSDNLSLGTYKKDELMELIKPFADQPALFKDYDIEITDPQSLKDFVNDFALGEAELHIKQMKKVLKEAGINDDTIETITQMSRYNKSDSEIPDVDITGCLTGTRYKLDFWIDDEETYNKLIMVYGVPGTQKLNTQLLVDNSL